MKKTRQPGVYHIIQFIKDNPHTEGIDVLSAVIAGFCTIHCIPCTVKNVERLGDAMNDLGDELYRKGEVPRILPEGGYADNDE